MDIDHKPTQTGMTAMRRAARQLLACAIIWLGLGAAAAAQSESDVLQPVEIEAKVVSLARDVVSHNKSRTDLSTEGLTELALSRSGQNRLRQIAMDSLLHRNRLDASNIAQLLSRSAGLFDNDINRQIADMIGLYLVIDPQGPDHPDSQQAMNDLRDYQISQNWFVASRAYLLESSLYINARDTHNALLAARKALNLVPRDSGALVQEAHFEIADILATIYVLQGNDELALEAYETMLEQAGLSARQFDTVGVLSNLVYLTIHWRSYEQANEIADLLLLESRGLDENRRGMAELWKGLALSNLNRFEEARPHIIRARRMLTSEGWKLSAEIHYATVLAGLGDIDGAKRQLDAIDKALEDQPRKKETADIHRERTEALIAIHEGRAWDAYAIARMQGDRAVRREMAKSSLQVQELLAGMEYEQTVEFERAQRLEVENDLNQQLLSRQRIAIALAVLVAFLLAGAVVYQRLVNRQLKASRDKAAAASKAKSEFLAVMSHELRTPLNGILGMSQSLAQQSRYADVAAKGEIIHKSGQGLWNLLSSILDMSRLEAGRMEVVTAPTNLRAMVSDLYELWKPAAEARGLTLTSFVSDEIPEFLELDGLRLRQCLNNLLSNAVKFTASGRIHIHVQPDAESPDMFEIIVIDTGQGISNDKLETLFEPFTQADLSLSRRHEGAGLGLSIAAGLVDLMGGKIQVNTSEGRGSEFKLSLPLKVLEMPATLPAANPPDDQAGPEARKIDTSMSAGTTDVTVLTSSGKEEFGGLNVLIAEDIDINRDILAVYFAGTGANLTMAENGRDAVSACDNAVFDVIIMDIRMPVMDGLEATREIRSGNGLNAATPIIALTADASEDNSADCKAAGVDIFLTKPVMAPELFDMIRIVTARAESEKRQGATSG